MFFFPVISFPHFGSNCACDKMNHFGNKLEIMKYYTLGIVDPQYYTPLATFLYSGLIGANNAWNYGFWSVLSGVSITYVNYLLIKNS